MSADHDGFSTAAARGATGGCGSDAAPSVASIDELHALDLEARIGAYRSRDARWVRGQPLVVGRDFDFLLSAAAEYGGPGMAAAQRSQANRSLAERLASVASIAPDELVNRLADGAGGRCSPLLQGRHVRLYGVLYGARHARLSVVLELVDAAGAITQHVSVGAVQDSSTFVEPGALQTALATGLDVLVAQLATDSGRDLPNSTVAVGRGRCSVGDRSGVSGTLAAIPGEAYAALDVVRAPFPMRVYCPAEALERAPLDASAFSNAAD